MKTASTRASGRLTREVATSAPFGCSAEVATAVERGRACGHAALAGGQVSQAVEMALSHVDSPIASERAYAYEVLAVAGEVP